VTVELTSLHRRTDTTGWEKMYFRDEAWGDDSAPSALDSAVSDESIVGRPSHGVPGADRIKAPFDALTSPPNPCQTLSGHLRLRLVRGSTAGLHSIVGMAPGGVHYHERYE
jgi:hypothetical protein